MSNRQKGHPLVLNEREGNSHTTGQTPDDHKTSTYTGTAKELPIYTRVTKKKMKTK